MSQYIKNDAHLMEIIRQEDPIYSLEMDDNNWFETFFDKLNGVETNNSFVSECDNVFEAITEIVENIEKWADEYKQQKGCEK